ncbi:MAG: hypothetical protein WKF79_03460 [Nocardioides sp.]
MTSRIIGGFLAVWSFGFACVHVAWAFGWRAGVPAEAAPIFERPVFWTYDVVAGVLMFVAAAVCLLLARGGLPRRARRVLETATLVGAGLALARGVPALVWDVATGDVGAHLGLAVDVWFTVAGLAGLALVRATRSRQSCSEGGGAISPSWPRIDAASK